MSLWSSWRAKLLSLAVAVVLVAAAVPAALRVPSHGSKLSLPRAASLDYTRGPVDGFSPLRAPFVSDVLGGLLDGARPLAGAEALIAGAGRAPDRASRLEAAPIVVSHSLTNDDFTRAYDIASVPFTARTDTTGATQEVGEPDGCAPVPGGTVWYVFRPSSDLALTANTFGTGYATAVAVYTGSSVSGLRAIACDGDARGNAQVVFPAEAGTPYRFQITASLTGGALVFNLERFGIVERISVGANGAGGDGLSGLPTVSADGRYVAFQSRASNLDPAYSRPLVPCSNPEALTVPPLCYQVYVRDRRTGATKLVSVGSDGQHANHDSALPMISSDGTAVVFMSWADNLVPGDTNEDPDIFVHELRTGHTTRVSVSSTGEQSEPSAIDGNWHPSISADGRYVVFNSSASNLVPGDTNSGWEAFVHDRATRTTVRVSIASSGAQQDVGYDGASGEYSPSISPDGRYAVFASGAANLVPGDTNAEPDVFVHDLATRRTTRISVADNGDQARGGRSILFTPGPHASADGVRVVFGSYATNLTPGAAAGTLQVYVRDLRAHTTSLVSVTTSGGPATASAGSGGLTIQETASISADGRFVVFNSRATDVVPDDTNGVADVFLRDLVRATTTRVSISPTGAEADDRSGYVSIAGDGSFLGFTSWATNLVVGDSNAEADAFVFEASRSR